MKSRSPFHLPDGASDTTNGDLAAATMFSGSFTSANTGSFPALTPIAPTLPDESVQAMAAVSGSGSGGVGSVVAETSSSGFTINLNFDAAAMAAPASFRAGIEQAAAILSATITNHITVNINIDYSGTGGGAAAGPDSGQFESYSTVRADLIANAAPGDTSFNALPTGSTIQGQSQVAVWNAQLKLFGLLSPNSTTTDDGSATFAIDINPNLLVGVALHELTHAMGRVPYGTQPDIFDFYRFTSAGTYLFQNGNTAPAAYFSLDGGNTKLADFGLHSDPSDFLNPANGTLPGPYSNLTPNDAFNELYGGGTLQSLTAVDKQMLDALGFSTLPPGLAVVANPADVVQGGPAVALLSSAPAINDPIGTLSSATVKIANAGGNAVVGDELFVNGVQNGSLGNGVTASWNATTDTLTLSGAASVSVYDTLLSEVTFQDTGTDASSGSHPVRTVTWTIGDGTNSYNASSQIVIDRAPVVSAANVTLSTTQAVAASSLFTATDLDGDAIATYAVENTGAGHFILNGVVESSNQEIDLSASQLAQLTYQSVAGSVDTLEVRANDGTAWGSWQTFTVTPTLAIQTDTNSLGTTVLTQVGNDYFLENSSGVGPELKYSGAPVTVGEFGPVTPVGAALTATGYEVAWHFTGTNNYTVWNTDSSGNFVSDTLGMVSGNNTTLETLETSFNQDINGDGVIGNPIIQTDINSLGTTALTQVANNYFLYNGSGVGPELKYSGAPVTVGEFGPVTPIGAALTATGYEVAWHFTGTNNYTVWNTDSSGNFVSDTIGMVPGNSAALESLETSFHQDINGDGFIGVVTTIQTDANSLGTTILNQFGSNYYLSSTGGAGPELKYLGSPVTTGEFGPVTPIGAALTATGYEVAWHFTGTNNYTVWNTDSSGNFVSDTLGMVAGNNTTLETLETSFNQDLNGDGTIGVPATHPVAASSAVVSTSPDNFQFRTDMGTGSNGWANEHNAWLIEMSGQNSSQLAALLNENQLGEQFQHETLFDGHGTPIGQGNHWSSHLTGDHSHHFFI